MSPGNVTAILFTLILCLPVAAIVIGSYKSIRKDKKEDKRIQESDINLFVKEMFKGVPRKKRTFVIGYGFVVAFRKGLGDEKFYAFVTSEWVEIQCGNRCYNYIMKFIRKYEAKKK